MHWQTPEQELPRWAQEIVVEDKKGNHFIAHYFPDNPAPWIVEMGLNTDGERLFYFGALLKTEDIAYWSNIDVREDD